MTIGLTQAERQRLIHDGLMRDPQPVQHFDKAHTPKMFGPKTCTPHHLNQNSPPENATLIAGKWISNRWLKEHGKI